MVYNRQRLDDIENIYASPVGAADRVYLAGREGTVLVLAHGDSYRVLAKNELDEGIDASPAIAGDAIFIRGTRHLYSFGNNRTSSDQARAASDSETKGQ